MRWGNEASPCLTWLGTVIPGLCVTQAELCTTGIGSELWAPASHIKTVIVTVTSHIRTKTINNPCEKYFSKIKNKC